MDIKIDISINNLSTTCRVCLLSTDLVPFLSLDTLKVFQEITKIEVNESDKLAKNICKNCVTHLEDIRLFIEQSIRNHSLFIAALEQTKNNKVTIDFPSGYKYTKDESLKKYEIFEETLQKPEEKVNNNIEEYFQCAICNMKFTIKRLLIHHLKVHNKTSLDGNKMVQNSKKNNNMNLTKNSKCDVRGEKLYSNFSLFRHKQMHNKRRKRSQTRNTRFGCSECDRILTSQSSLNNHMKTHTGDRPYKCTYCKKNFPYISSLTVHTRLHTGETPYICTICNKGYRSSTSLKKHKETKHPVEQAYLKEVNQKDDLSEDLNKVECPICNKVLSKHGYGTHMRTHTNEKKLFHCTYCEKVFQKKSHLERHIRIHTGERPYVCNVCNKRFTQDGDLKRHIIIHSGQKEFQCQHCGKQFFTRSSLSTHILHHKGTEKPSTLACKICKKPSGECDKAAHANNINPQLGQISFLCTICGKSFTASSSLKVHHRLHTGENPFVCNLCNKAYNNSSALKRHVMRNHTGEKPHGCMICQKRFHDSTNLKRHINKVHSVLEIKNGNRSTETEAV